MRAVLTIQSLGFVGQPPKLRCVPLCLGHGLLMSQTVIPIAGDCAWCVMGDDPWARIRSGKMPGLNQAKKIIRRRLTVR